MDRMEQAREIVQRAFVPEDAPRGTRPDPAAVARAIEELHALIEEAESEDERRNLMGYAEPLAMLRGSLEPDDG